VRYLALPLAPGKWSTVGLLRLPRFFAREEAVSLRMTRQYKCGKFNLTLYQGRHSLTSVRLAVQNSAS
jgi:hypothetical protein